MKKDRILPKSITKNLIQFDYLKKSIKDLDDEITDDYYSNRQRFLDHLDKEIEKQRWSFLKEIRIRTLISTTDYKVKLNIQSGVNAIKSSSQTIKSLKGTSVQRIIVEKYLKSYADVLIHMAQTYEDYYPKSDIKLEISIRDSNLKKHVFEDQLLLFKDVNSRLVNSGLIRFESGTYTWLGKKNELVDFCRELNKRRILNISIKLNKHIKFFEDYYNLEVGDQSKPSKYKLREINSTKFSYLFY